MKIELIEIAGFESFVRALRLPYNSGHLSDTKINTVCETRNCKIICDYKRDVKIGEKDIKLAISLLNKGTDHSKAFRMIDVWVLWEAPRYFWQQVDTYRMGVEKVSASTMHTLMKQEIRPDDFEGEILKTALDRLNGLRVRNEFTQLKKELPEGYLQKRIVKLSYQSLVSMYRARRTHKLEEWQMFCSFCESLPYFKELVL